MLPQSGNGLEKANGKLNCLEGSPGGLWVWHVTSLLLVSLGFFCFCLWKNLL